MIDKEQLQKQYKTLIDLLIKEQNKDGFWTGRLSSSALSTAVAVTALKIKGSSEYKAKIEKGLDWLLLHVNGDGGFGDTPESQSNVSTSLLCYAVINYCGKENLQVEKALKGLEQYLFTQNISLNPETITSSVLKHYGNDYTFSVPILSMLVVCGVMDENSCKYIPQLPFEFILLPSSWYSFFNLRVVSYALPALIAMGIFIFEKRKRHNPLMVLIRKNSIQPALKKLVRIVPGSGGFLEATPLTAFVSMCLISAGYRNNAVVEKGIDFLNNQQRSDGSWPIDTDLSTWVTTLSIKALGSDAKDILKDDNIDQLKNHLLSIHYKERHPFNNALPGGWGWTNYSGSVPDVDDTCGAILALLELYKGEDKETQAIINGCKWLLAQQNSDGGFPTFCRGWGRLPFDSSCSDLTGHAFCALMSTIEKLGDSIPGKLRKAFYNRALQGLKYLKREQHESGYWLPLWFGNQSTQDKTNPVYGTAKVRIYLSDCMLYKCLDERTKDDIESMTADARNFLVRQQNDDGSWGGALGIKGSVEETSLAICALSKTDKESCLRGFHWLDETYKKEGLPSSPIGLYFAALWYDERLYPLIYYTEALRRFLQ
jgi:prenyltransferase beta subunit